MIFVVASIELAEGRREDFLQEVEKLVPMVLAENGCIEYGPAVDVSTGIEIQEFAGTETIVMMEKWESVEALKAHLAAPHMQEFGQAVKEMRRGVTLQVLEPA